MPHRLLRVSSKDRSVESKSKYNFTFNTNDDDLHQVKSVILKSAIIPNTQYNVNDTNNVLTYRQGGVPVSVELMQGQYSISSFITSMQILCAPIGLTIVQHEITKKLLLGTTTAIQWLNIKLNPMAIILGIEEDTVEDVMVYTPSAIPNLRGLQHLYIASNMLSSNTSMVTEDSHKINVFADITINVPFGAVQIVDNDSKTLDRTDFGSKKNIISIDIRLLDVHNRVIDLNGHDFTLIFVVI